MSSSPTQMLVQSFLENAFPSHLKFKVSRQQLWKNTAEMACSTAALTVGSALLLKGVLDWPVSLLAVFALMMPLALFLGSVAEISMNIEPPTPPPAA